MKGGRRGPPRPHRLRGPDNRQGPAFQENKTAYCAAAGKDPAAFNRPVARPTPWYGSAQAVSYHIIAYCQLCPADTLVLSYEIRLELSRAFPFATIGRICYNRTEWKGGIAVSAYRAALCEDEAAERDQLIGLCRDILDGLGIEPEIVPFASADALRQAVEGEQTAFDLFLLDIEMKEGASGLELARWLYDRGIRDRILFLTGNPEYALVGYDVHPLHYLLKPVSRERLEDALGRALEKQGAQAVRFQRGGKAVPLPLREIRYLESRNHGVVVDLGDGEQAFSIPLTEAERLLPAGAFCRCHKSYLVNLTWVKRATHGGVLLKDGRKLPMSRTFYAGFQNALVHRLND